MTKKNQGATNIAVELLNDFFQGERIKTQVGAKFDRNVSRAPTLRGNWIYIYLEQLRKKVDTLVNRSNC